MQGETGDITRLLASWRAGDRTAMDRLLHLLQRELQQIARRHLAGERKDHTMQPSSLVQEAFLRRLPGRDLGCGNDAVHTCVAPPGVKWRAKKSEPREAD